MNAWTLAYDGFDPPGERLREALCTLGNGYFATRGAAPEAAADAVHYPGTYVAGCYNRLVSRVAGREVENEDLVNVPNWLPLTFRPQGGRWLDLDELEVLGYRQELDLRRGVLTRLLRVRDPDGRVTRVTQRRFVSMADPHLAGLETTVVPENWSGSLEVRSALDGTVTNAGVERYKALDGRHLVPIEAGAIGDDTVWLQVETRTSRVRIAQAASTRVVQNGQRVAVERRTVQEPGFVAQHLTVDVREGEPVTVEKLVALYTSKDRAIAEPGDAARGRVERLADGFDQLLERHVLAWDQLWRRCRIDLGDDGDQEVARTLNLHVFHLLQTVSEHTIDLDVGVPARGLHGEAYRGHIFWDELFIFPFLNLRFPELTRALLRYRYRRLPEARQAARAAGYSGAMYPWQSGSDGREETQRLHLNPQIGPLAARQVPPPAPRQHRRRLQRLAVLPGHRRPGVPVGLRRRDAAGDRPLLGQHRHLRPRPGPLRDPRGHGARRVPRRLPRPRRARPGQQRLHQRDGRLGPVPGAGDPGAAPRPPPHRAGRAARAAARGAGPLGGGQPQAARPASTTATSSASSRATATWRSWTGRACGAATATSAGWTASWRPRATPPTATRPPSRPTC